MNSLKQKKDIIYLFRVCILVIEMCLSYNETNETKGLYIFDFLFLLSVPIKYVEIENSSEDVIKTVENITTTLICQTSAGRPAASITWRKMSKTGMNTDLTHTAIYDISEQDNGMIISQSRIDLRPLRQDNDTRIICETTNNISNITQKEVRIYIQCKFAFYFV
jgi:hypothetical protein